MVATSTVGTGFVTLVAIPAWCSRSWSVVLRLGSTPVFRHYPGEDPRATAQLAVFFWCFFALLTATGFMMLWLRRLKRRQYDGVYINPHDPSDTLLVRSQRRRLAVLTTVSVVCFSVGLGSLAAALYFTFYA